jgi:hypothetical protein
MRPKRFSTEDGLDITLTDTLYYRSRQLTLGEQGKNSLGEYPTCEHATGPNPDDLTECGAPARHMVSVKDEFNLGEDEDVYLVCSACGEQMVSSFMNAYCTIIDPSLS